MRVLGAPVSVGFAFPVVMIGLGWLGTHDLARLVAWIVLVTASVLIHEAGHAVALHRFGFAPEIELTAMGGLTSTTERRRISTWNSIAVSLAGPAAGVAFGLTMEVMLLGAPGGIWLWVRHVSWFVNIWWSAFNLLPIMPLDGGHVTRELIQRAARERGRAIGQAALVIGGVTALLCWALWDRPIALAVILVLMVVTNAAQLELTARQREDYRMELAHEQLVAGNLSEGIAELLPFAMSSAAPRMSTEAYTTLGWALLHERRYAELSALDPARFHEAHRGLLEAATFWFHGDVGRATAATAEALANSNVEPPDTYFSRVFLRLGELDRLGTQIAALPRDSAQRAGSRLHSCLATRCA